MTATFYEIQSGKPDGEIQHRRIFAARSAEEAEDCRRNILAVSESWPGESDQDSWHWGPHIYERPVHPLNEDDSGPAEFWTDWQATHKIA